MEVILLTDLTIDGNPLASGERVTISEMSGRLLIRKGQAIEYKPPVSFHLRETAVIDDKAITQHSNGGGIVKRQHGKRKVTPQG